MVEDRSKRTNHYQQYHSQWSVGNHVAHDLHVVNELTHIRIRILQIHLALLQI